MAARRKRNLNFLPEQQPIEPAVDANGLPLDIGVGELLRMYRERNGQELQSVANQLRVRVVYLQAIEDGRFKDLPGTTYAVGFLRSYADFLGLDSADVVRRFREEVARAHGQPRLVFPNVTAEGKIPGSALLLISVLGAAVVYAAWYYISSRQTVDLPLIAEVPDRLVALPPDEGTAVTSGASEKKPEEDAASSGQSPENSAGTSAATESPTIPSATSSGVEPNVSSSTIASNQLQAPTTGGDAIGAATTGGPADDSTASAAGASTAAASEQPSESPGNTGLVGSPEFIPQAPPMPPEPPPPEIATEAVTAPAQLGPRILIEARIDSWIEILDGEGKVVTAQVLRAGESFAPPDLPGMTLTTGNAGGIDVIVDGVKTPPLGDVGAVMRKVSLEPEKLRAGQAVSE
jgi:cytoskeleton protein RodZ